MASPAETSGRNAPVTRSTRMTVAAAPAVRLMVARSCADTEPSAVTTTRSAAASTYQATPLTPDFPIAALAADSWALVTCLVAAGAADGRISASAATRPMTTPPSRAVFTQRWDGRSLVVTDPPEHVMAQARQRQTDRVRRVRRRPE